VTVSIGGLAVELVLATFCIFFFTFFFFLFLKHSFLFLGLDWYSIILEFRRTLVLQWVLQGQRLLKRAPISLSWMTIFLPL